MTAEARVVDEAPALAVDRLRIELRSRGTSTALVHDVSFTLGRGERLALVGESGSGKTITALSLMRLLRDPLVLAGGSISLGGRTELTTMSDDQLAAIRGARVAMIYQDPLTALNPVLRIGHQLVEAIRLHSPLSKAAARSRAIELLGQVGLSQPASRIDAYPHQFSGGMRQRVMMAMALSGDPEVLIADEPTTALDVTTQARILALLDDLVSERGISVLLITHDLGIAAGFCDRVHVMYAGRIVERSDVFSLYANPLHPYSEALLDAVCRLDLDLSHPIPAIPGYPPAPTALPEGCVFHPRCGSREDRCLTEAPDDVVVGERMAACHFAARRQRPVDPPQAVPSEGVPR
jgi:oligopeptide/dipeptide ABC transporter ATP-binding protein